MTAITKNRTIRPSSRAASSKSYKIDTKAVESEDTLIVNIDHESDSFSKQYNFDGKDLKAKNSISFRVSDNGTGIQISWPGASHSNARRTSSSRPGKTKKDNSIKSEKKPQSSNKKAKGGFEGFIKVKDIRKNYSLIPNVKGIYEVLNPDYKSPKYINPGVGGFFKGKDPNVPTELLKENEVVGSEVVYIGKAGAPNKSATLRSRLKQYLRFGEGKNVGHWGGRYIWQLANHEELVICWKKLPNEDPREVEKELIKVFHKEFGKKPFANLVG